MTDEPAGLQAMRTQQALDQAREDRMADALEAQRRRDKEAKRKLDVAMAANPALAKAVKRRRARKDGILSLGIILVVAVMVYAQMKGG